MKEFDIDKLKRENIFKTPKGFFDEMQSKVLQEITPIPQRRSMNLNWVYGAAAAVALTVGVSVFVKSDPAEEIPAIAKIVSMDEAPTTYTLSEFKPQKEELVALEVLEKDLTAVAAISENKNAKENSISVEPARNIETQKESRVSPNPEAQVDQILASFTSAELSAVGRNTEQDIYLDLYN